MCRVCELREMPSDERRNHIGAIVAKVQNDEPTEKHELMDLVYYAALREHEAINLRFDLALMAEMLMPKQLPAPAEPPAPPAPPAPTSENGEPLGDLGGEDDDTIRGLLDGLK